MNTDNLRTFLQGDGILVLTAIAVLTIKLGETVLGFNFLLSRWVLCRHCLNRNERTRKYLSGRLVPKTL